jgi:ribonuclease HII
MASIIAKVTRDRLITEADSQWPAYGFAVHKGYGTKKHLEAIRRLGPSPIQRLSFKIKQLS